MRRLSHLLVTVALFGSACGGSGRARPSTSSAVITRAELGAAIGVSTYDAVLRLRPYFFRDRGPTSLVNQSTRTRSVVFVDDREYGEIESLKNFPAERVEEVRFYSGQEATTRFGSAYGAGVIQLRMRTR